MVKETKLHKIQLFSKPVKSQEASGSNYAMWWWASSLLSPVPYSWLTLSVGSATKVSGGIGLSKAHMPFYCVGMKIKNFLMYKRAPIFRPGDIYLSLELRYKTLKSPVARQTLAAAYCSARHLADGFARHFGWSFSISHCYIPVCMLIGLSSYHLENPVIWLFSVLVCESLCLLAPRKLHHMIRHWMLTGRVVMDFLWSETTHSVCYTEML